MFCIGLKDINSQFLLSFLVHSHMLDFPLQFVAALLYANLGEWLLHKIILHGLGKNPKSIWSFHLYEHHANAARYGMLDPGYRKLDLSTWNAQTKELLLLSMVLLAHSPLIALAPVFCLTLYASLGFYYFKHRKAHLDPVWAKKHLSWHYHHHTNPDHGNWCVTWPWFDYILGSRCSSDQEL